METKIRYIGDIHGKYHEYNAIVYSSPYPTVQVGDFGIGFPLRNGTEPNFLNDYGLYLKHTFIRGNHDNPSLCKINNNWLVDGFIDNKTMFIGGANSIDKHSRIEGVSWWRDEECSYEQFQSFIDRYVVYKPEIMVTHTCPTRIAKEIFSGEIFGSFTENTFQFMFDKLGHRPKVWIFGHWHHSIDTIIDGTRFVCLDELETKDIGE